MIEPLIEKGLRNYWGYNTIGFFLAPEPRYSSTGNLNEFKTMVKNLAFRRNRGDFGCGLQPQRLKVIRWGPTLSFRGIDNPVYYRTDGEKSSLLRGLQPAPETL